MATNINDLQLNMLADASRAVQAIERLSNAMRQLQNATGVTATSLNKVDKGMKKIGSSANSASTGFRKVGTSAKTSAGSVNRLRASLRNVGTSLLAIVGGANVFYKLVQGIRAAVRESNEYQETLNLFQVSMGDTRYKVSELTDNMKIFGATGRKEFESLTMSAQDFAERVAEVMGIDPAEWMRSQGAIQNILGSFGVGREQAALMSEQLTQLGYDISSLHNTDIETSFQKIQSGIAGEIEPLRRLGYDLSIARLEQERLNLGIQKSVSNMTQAEKSQLRYIALMKQTASAQGDMARTLESPANQMRILKAQMTQTSRAIGNMFIPMLQRVIPIAIAVLQVIRKLANFLATLFGFKITDVDYSNLQDYGSAVDDLGDAQNNAAKGTKRATKALKEYKKQLLGFDKINNLTKPDKNNRAGGSGGSGAIGGGGIDFGNMPTYDFLGNVSESKAAQIANKITSFLEKFSLVIATFLLALGVIVLFSGLIPVGIGLIAAACASYAVAIKWGSGLSEEIKKRLAVIVSIISGAMVAIGIILIFTGVGLPLGLGLVIAGAALLGAGRAIMSGGGMKEKIQKMLKTIMTAISASIIALGVMLLFTGVGIPLGLGLIMLGAGMLVTSVAPKTSGLAKNVKKGLNKAVRVIKGVAYTALGIAVFAANPKAGIGLILKGIKGISGGKFDDKALADSLKKMLDKAKKTIKEKVGNIFSWFFGGDDSDGSKFKFADLFDFGGSEGSTLSVGINIKDKFVDVIKNWAGTNPVIGGIKALFGSWDKDKSFKDNVGNMIANFKEWAKGNDWKNSIGGMVAKFADWVKQSGKGGFSNTIGDMVARFKSWTKQTGKGGFKNEIGNLVAKFKSWTKASTFKNQITGLVAKFSSWTGIGSKKADGGVLTGNGWKPVNQYAGGGSPMTGEVFIAREAGPEMVGRIGGRTAVMNNNQIVASVASGVAEANAAQNALLMEQNKLLRQLIRSQGGETALTIDGVTFGKVAARSINKAQTQSGQILINI